MYVDDGNVFDGRLHAFKENTEAVVVVSKKTGLVVNAEKYGTWSYLEVRMQNEVVLYNFFFGKALKYQNTFQEHNKSRL